MLGIDVSKDTLSCTLFDPATQQPRWNREVPNTAAGVARLLRMTPMEAPWALEPTGRYSQTVARSARDAGRAVLLAEPKRAKKYLDKKYLESLQERAKTDRLDSYGLGLYALTHRLPPYPLKPAMVEHLDQLLTARRGLSQAIASLQVRIAELPHAALVLRESVAILQQQRCALDTQIEQLTVSESIPTAQTADATPAVEPQTTPFAAMVALQKVPGIGPITAASIVSRLASRHFPHSDAFVAYCGLDVKISQSGKRKGQRGLTKQGDAELRRLLYLAAKASLRSRDTTDTTFRVQYERELAKGLSKTAALCAVARKAGAVVLVAGHARQHLCSATSSSTVPATTKKYTASPLTSTIESTALRSLRSFLAPSGASGGG